MGKRGKNLIEKWHIIVTMERTEDIVKVTGR
jgi:hypothetical protein